MQMLCAASSGFVYAVTMTGTTGKNVAVPQEVLDYFARVKRVSPLPVCAGFGIRSREQVERLAPHVDGVIVGSALVEVLERGEDPAAFLRGSAVGRALARRIFLTPVRSNCSVPRRRNNVRRFPSYAGTALHGDGDSDGHEMVAGRAAWIEEAAAHQAACSGDDIPRGFDNSRRQRLRRRPSLHGQALPVRARAASAAADVRRSRTAAATTSITRIDAPDRGAAAKSA